jgi:membrane fusion protein (multidrug efflux system)
MSVSHAHHFQGAIRRLRWPLILVVAAACLSSPSDTFAGNVEGFAEAYRHIEVATGSDSGLITQVLVREGDSVAKHQIVATLDTSVLEASLAIARRRSQLNGRLDAATAELQMRQKRLQKLYQLQQRGHASPAELDRAQADREVAEAQVKLANEERELARLECDRIEAQIEQRRLRSPIDGVVVEVFREVGESTQISDPRLLTLVQLNPLRVKFPVSIDQSANFHKGDFVVLELPEFGADADATVEVVAPVLDAKSGTVQITCVIDNQNGTYRSGMRCLLEVDGKKRRMVDEADSDFESEF